MVKRQPRERLVGLDSSWLGWPAPFSLVWPRLSAARVPLVSVFGDAASTSRGAPAAVGGRNRTCQGRLQLAVHNARPFKNGLEDVGVAVNSLRIISFKKALQSNAGLIFFPLASLSCSTNSSETLPTANKAASLRRRDGVCQGWHAPICPSCSSR